MEGGGEVTREKTRIYVGGLGGGVTEDDLRKTFSALGEVVAVDVVRTKDRSFAYLDFLPSSDKSLPKLFSTYNGCMWKGGKLRLEKAKEHYLERLKREWQEESENAKKASENSSEITSETHDTSEKPKKPLPADKTQIQIFFPKLGKVKSLDQVGIGKHKYSFQRIQVPTLPTHFCDCEEHAPAFIPTNKKQTSELEKVSDGINKQELDIMNSVMNKIFQRANPSKQVIKKSASESGELAPVEDDEEDHLTDEDNLIINVASGSDGLDLLAEMRNMMAKQASQKPVSKRLVTSSEKPKSVDDSSEKTTVPLNKKRKSSHTEENNSNDLVTPETSRNKKSHLDTQKDKKTEVKSSNKKQAESNSLRSLKSTWNDLVGQQRKKPINISDIIASIPQRKEKENKSYDNDHPLTNDTLEKTNLVHNKISISEVSDPKEEELTITQKTNESDVLPDEQQDLNESDVLAGATYEQKDLNESDVLSDEQEDHDESDDLPDEQKDLDESDDLPDEERDLTDTDDLPDEQKDVNESDVLSDEQKDVNEPIKVKNNEDLIRTARGESWRHKSSWTQLISNTSHTSFSISQIVPNLSFEKPEQKAADTFDSQPQNTNLETSSTALINKDQSLVKKNTSEHKRTLSLRNLESEDTCSFMRTEESMKEWKKAKAGSLYKKKRAVKESG